MNKHGISKACIYCKYHSMEIINEYFEDVCTVGKKDVRIVSPRFHTCSKWEKHNTEKELKKVINVLGGINFKGALKK